MSYANYDDVVDQLREAGLVLELPLKVATGSKSVRCLVDGGDAEKRGWYRLHEWLMDSGDLMLVGSFGVFHGDDPGTCKVELTKKCTACSREMGLKEKACPSCGSKDIQKRGLSDEQKAALKDRMAQDKKRAQAERNAEIEQAAQWAAAVWRSCREPEPNEHGYLARKKLKTTGGARIFVSNDGINLVGANGDDYKYLSVFHGALVVPMCDATGKVFGLQFILDRIKHKDRISRTERDKDYWPAGMSVESHYWLIGPSPSVVCLTAEGFATGLTLHEETGHPVAVAFAANNLGPVAKAIKSQYRRAKQLICADDDFLQRCAECKTYTIVAETNCTHCGKPHRKQNAGVSRAADAALAVDGTWIAPVFAAPRPVDRKGPTDFNDLAALEGPQAVRAQIEQRLVDLKIAPVPAAPSRDAGNSPKGGGEIDNSERFAAVSTMRLDDLVERFIYVDDPTGDFVFDYWTNEVCKSSKMIKLLPARVRGDDIKEHYIWKSRAVYIDQIGFDPGGEDKNVICNRWRGWPTKPKAGCCDMLLDLLRFICSGDAKRDEVFQWMLCWLAYPIQHPGAKMHTAIVVHGPQGTGKSRFFEAYAKIFGDYSIVINQGAIEDKFNSDWSERKLFVLADEIVARSDMYHLKNQLKAFITGEWVRVNPKNVAAHKERNHMNLVFTSNERMPTVLEDDDRRHCVVWTPPKMDEVFYAEVNAEIEQGGIEALHQFLLDLDLGDFKPWTKPPMTEAKANLINLSISNEENFLRDWQAGEIDGLPFCPIGTRTLYREYQAWGKRVGEIYLRSEKQFFAAALRPGWSRCSPDRYVTLDSSETKTWRCLIPSNEAMAKSKGKDYRQPEGTSKTRWLTECYFAVENAINDREEEK